MSPLTINVPMECARADLLDKLASGVYATELTACFCGSSAVETVSEWDRYDIPSKTHLCLNCGLGYVSPRLTREAARQFYEQEYRQLYQTAFADTPDHISTSDEEFDRSVENGQALRDLLENYDLHPQSVLDIGCNEGGMLKPFQDVGLTVSGVDWDAGTITRGRQRGMPVQVGETAGLIAAGQKADLVILHHVLEHCHDLRQTLEDIRQVMTKDGILWIGVPGIKLTPLSSMFQSAHLWHFTFDTLEYVMNCCGFTRIYCSEDIYSLWRYTGLLRKPDAVHPTALNDILDRFGRDPQCIHELKTVSKFPVAIQRQNMEAMLAAGFPDLHHIRGSMTGQQAVIIAGGPSVEGQFPALRRLIAAGGKVVAIEKMNDFCLKHGIVPDYVVSTDASEDVADSLRTLSPASIGVVATQCGQRAADALKGKTVYVFSAPHLHVDMQALFNKYPCCEKQCPATVINAGGSVALTAMTVSMVLGMQHLHIFGFDCHITDGNYATGITGVGPTYHQEWIDIKEKDGTIVESFLTTPPYLAFAQQFFQLVNTGRELGFLKTVKVYGRSMVTAMSVEDLRGE